VRSLFAQEAKEHAAEEGFAAAAEPAARTTPPYVPPRRYSRGYHTTLRQGQGSFRDTGPGQIASAPDASYLFGIWPSRVSRCEDRLKTD